MPQEPKEAAEAERNRAQESLLNGVQHLLRFAVMQATVPVDGGLIDATVRATSVSIPMTPDQEAELWKIQNFALGSAITGTKVWVLSVPCERGTNVFLRMGL